LSAAGFILAGISDDHQMAILNGIYSKVMDKLEAGRYIYLGPGDSAVWHSSNGCWNAGLRSSTTTASFFSFAIAKSLAASPENISPLPRVWGSETWQCGITITALNSQALAAAKLATDHTFDEAIEQAAPSFVLAGLDSNHKQAGVMGVYQRQDDREKVDGRFSYKGPNGYYLQPLGDARGWTIVTEEQIGTEKFVMFAISAAPVPESIQHQIWQVCAGDHQNASVYDVQLTITAILHKSATFFKGQCELCVHCRKWRRCGRCSSGAMYCSAECQRAQ
jgi:hypothetical protein